MFNDIPFVNVGDIFMVPDNEVSVVSAATTPPFVRSAYNYDRDAASDAAGLECPEPTKAQQHQADEADINTIVRRFGITGAPPVIPLSDEIVSVESMDLREAMDQINAAQRSFMSLDAETRARFNNDPARFVNFAQNPDNLEELVKLGLAVKRPDLVESPPQRVVVVSENGDGKAGKDGNGK